MHTMRPILTTVLDSKTSDASNLRHARLSDKTRPNPTWLVPIRRRCPLWPPPFECCNGRVCGMQLILPWAAETWGNSTRPSASKWKTLTDGDASSKPAALETHGKSGWTIHHLRPWDTTSFNGKASFGSWRCRLVQMFNSVFNFNLTLRKHLESFGQILEKLVLKFGWTHAMSDFVYKA